MSGGGTVFLGYHELAPSSSRDVYTITPTLFAEHIKVVRSMFCDSAGAITFDDADISQVHWALPLLSATGTIAQFFVPTARVGQPETATWAHLREMAQLGHRIGSHSHTHPLLTQCPPARLRDELESSKKMLEDNLGGSTNAISLPGGRHNAVVLKACALAGYERVYTSAPGIAEIRQFNDGTQLEIVGRLIVRRGMSLSTLIGYLAQDRAVARRLGSEHAWKQRVKDLLGDTLYQRLWRASLRRLPESGAAADGDG
jgi:peptidoglycan/xylan/chitin deacetylase (PgdA/CDA1 family)